MAEIATSSNNSTMRLAIGVSGAGSNLRNLLDLEKSSTNSLTKIVAVFADRECAAEQHAKTYQLPWHRVSRKKSDTENREIALNAFLDAHQVDGIVLAGYLSIFSSNFCQQWQSRIINLHPSLLPKHGGAGMWGDHVHRAVLESGNIESGATVHHVSAEIDAGDIIAQSRCPVQPDDSIETLAARVHEVEYTLLPQAVAQFVSTLSQRHQTPSEISKT